MSSHSAILGTEDYPPHSSSGLLPSFESSEPYEPYSAYHNYPPNTEPWEPDFYSSGHTQQGGLTGLSLSSSYNPGFSQSLTDLPMNPMTMSNLGGSYQDTRDGEISGERQTMYGEGAKSSFYDYRQPGLKIDSGNSYMWESSLYFENGNSFH